MSRIDPEVHGLPDSASTIDLEDLQVTAVDLLQGMDRQERVGQCGRLRVPISDAVAAYGDSQAEARYMTGVCRCEDAWTCPPCAFAAQLDTRNELEEAIQEAKDRGWWVYMLTVTVPHTLELSLEDTNRVLLDAGSYLKSGNQWKDRADGIGYVGAIRTYEVTHGREHGWHPHLHYVLILEEKLEPEPMEELRRWALARVEKRVRSWYWTDDGELKRWPMNRNPPADFVPAFRELHPEHGVRIDGAQNAASYVAKLGLSREVSGFMEKAGKGGNRTPFQLLLDYHIGGDPEDGRLFREYVEAVAGRSRWHWTPGMKGELLEADPEELTEDEKLEREQELLEERALCFKIGADLWDALRYEVRVGALNARLIDEYNRGGLDRLFHFIESQFRWSKRRARVRMHRDRRYLWIAR